MARTNGSAEKTVLADDIAAPTLTGWTHSGDHHYASIVFREDGAYTFAVEGCDLAENPLTSYETGLFVIDMTPPELAITGVADRSANNGEAAPEVRCADVNYDPEGTGITLEGSRKGSVKLAQPWSDIHSTDTGMTVGILWSPGDFAYTRDEDDLYTLTAVSRDLAGNVSRKSIRFSVNRFGSVYTLDEDAEKLVGENGRYYTNQEQDIVVTETNVDTLAFREITKNRDGALQTLQEGVEYTVEQNGSEESWKQYTYRISADNFREEGRYVLTLYSEDRASNAQDNSAKGKQIEFVVDKTAPSILISGLEDNGQYQESSRDVILDVEDNILLAEVRVVLNGAETVYTASQLAQTGGRLQLTADSANHWQTLRVTATDAAGNIQVSDGIRFLLTTNPVVQVYRNPMMFWIGLVLVILLLTAGGFWLSIKYSEE